LSHDQHADNLDHSGRAFLPRARRGSFVLTFPNEGARPIYVTGDTVWWDGVAEVARRFAAGVVLLYAGAAQTRGPFNLTMNANDAIETAHAFSDAVIVPVRQLGTFHARPRRP